MMPMLLTVLDCVTNNKRLIDLKLLNLMQRKNSYMVKTMSTAVLPLCQAGPELFTLPSVSYTHLDVYKRQILYLSNLAKC